MGFDRQRIALFALALGWVCCADASGANENLSTVAQFRRPVAAVWLDEGRTLAAANRTSGTISIVDFERRQVQAEYPIGKQLADLAVLPDGQHLLTIDDVQHALVALRYDRGQLQVVNQVKLSPYPVSIALNRAGTHATVAGLWSRRLDYVEIRYTEDAVEKLRLVKSIQLPFAPRHQLALPGPEKFLVADAFAGKLAIVDADQGAVEATYELPAHNIQGLALGVDGNEVYVSHQILASKLPTTRVNIEAGTLIQNVARFLPVDALRSGHLDLESLSEPMQLGHTGRGSGDPAGIVVLDENQYVVAISGMNEVLLADRQGWQVARIPTGARPTQLLVHPDGNRVVAVNQLSDSISIVDVADRESQEVVLGPTPELGPQERGELLFYDADISHDAWLSCHSCHTNGHSNGQLSDTAGDGSYGAPKRVLSLRGVRDTDRWAWNGAIKELHDQVRQSVETTMHGVQPAAEISDLAAFLHTLDPVPPLDPPTSDAEDRAQLERGRRIFEGQGCVQCHVPPLTYTSQESYDVGLTDERGNRKFNPPSLRGVGQRSGYFHDKRAEHLREVFTVYGHQLSKDLTEAELADLLRFLRSL